MQKEARYINRELSWLDFNQRVLHECFYTSYDPFEKLSFSAIFSNNLDEFFMVRVSGLQEKKESSKAAKDFSGLSPGKQLKEIRKKVNYFIDFQSEITDKIIREQLVDYSISIVRKEDLNGLEYEYLKNYFFEDVYPVLTPLAIDAARPFPLVLNRSLNLIVSFEDGNRAIVQVPTVLDRFVETHKNSGRFIMLEDLIKMFAFELLDSGKISDIAFFRVTRNAGLDVKVEEADDLLQNMEKSIFKRRFGAVIRLEISSDCPDYLIEYLKENLDIDEDFIYKIKSILDYTCLFKIASIAKDYEPKKKYEAKVLEYQEENIFEFIKKQDVFLHHPFDSFDIITKMVEDAAEDPKVLAIKQVLYRVSGDSPIIHALSKAARKGKQVTVLVELFARFDEENNVQWAKEMEKSGCHVIFGKPGIKTHAKILLIVRKEENGIRRYLHLGTGNYNDKTAKLYTDMGILTCNESMGEDATIFFNMLSGYANADKMNHIVAAPNKLKPKIIRLINGETFWAKKARPALIYAKMNALVDKDVIDALYEASQAGVKIKLLIRGICCLRAGVEGLSENIEVFSVIGEYLEHSRIYYFLNNREDKLYISSADWMPRNLIRRVELLNPIYDEYLKEKIIQILENYFASPEKTRKMLPSSSYYSLISPDENSLPMQEKLKSSSVGVSISDKH